MKAAVIARGLGLDSQVDSRFGKGHYFVVVDTDTGRFSSHENKQTLDLPVRAAGIQAAMKLGELGVDVLITANVGPNAMDALDAIDIKVYTEACGTVRDAIEDFKAGQLLCAIEAHWAQPSNAQTT